MQQDFAESAAILKRLKSDYERVKELFAENIGTKKEYILAESAFNAENARYNGLKMKLEYHGLDASHIENGTFYSSYFVKSPIRGYVSGITASMGQYVDNQQVIAEVVDDQSFQLMLSVFEKDIQRVKPGQRAEFYLAGNDSDVYSAEVTSVGKTVGTDTRSIDCYAQIVHPDLAGFVGNQFIQGNITVASDSALSVPETAVIQSGNENYVLILENETGEHYFFRKEKITIGRKNSGSVELLDAEDAGKMVIKGVYNLQL
jgi:cobalt-zinc-cadmium efflux system membrane fusion protein